MPANVAVIDVGIAHPEVVGINVGERGQACGAGVVLFLEYPGDVLERQVIFLLQVALRILYADAFIADTALASLFKAEHGILVTPSALRTAPTVGQVGHGVRVDPTRPELRVASTSSATAGPCLRIYVGDVFVVELVPVRAPVRGSGVVANPIVVTVHERLASQVPPQSGVLVMDAQQPVFADVSDRLTRCERLASAVLEHPPLNIDERVLACRVAFAVVIERAAVFVRHPFPDQAPRLGAFHVLEHHFNADRGPGTGPLEGSVPLVIAIASLAPGAPHPRRGSPVAGFAQL